MTDTDPGALATTMRIIDAVLWLLASWLLIRSVWPGPWRPALMHARMRATQATAARIGAAGLRAEIAYHAAIDAASLADR